MANNPVLSNLGHRLKEMFSQIESERQAKELEWANALRQFRGEYDPEVLSRIRANGGNEVYPKITRAKVLTALSRIHEIVFPDLDRNWSIEPSPNPDIPKQKVIEIMKSLIITDEKGNPARPPDEIVKSAIYDFSLAACSNMEREIDDQLTEIDYEQEAKRAVMSGLIFGTGIVKGPLAIPKTDYQWKATESDYVSVPKFSYKPYVEFVPVWDFYPDMSSVELDLCEGIFQRHILTKHELRELAKRKDFDGEAIYEYLRANKDGDAPFKSWEIDIQLSSESYVHRRDRKYEVLEYWGYVDGEALKQAGVEVSDDNLDVEFEANVWLLGDNVIKIVLNPNKTQARPFHVFYYEKDETSIFGTGIPMICRDSQTAICAASRMLLDNASVTAGPQLEINTDLLSPVDQDLTNIHPRKVWYREGRGAEAQYPAIRSLEFNSHMQELMAIINQFKQFADEETTIPTYMMSEPMRTTNETARGISMRMSSINMTIKDIVRRFDQMNISFIKSMYAWNMQFNPKEDIKGDFSVVAKGSTSLVSKEVRMQALDFFIQTLTPMDETYINRRALLSERLKAHDLRPEEILKSEEEAQAEQQAMMQQPQGPPPEVQQAQMEAMKADTDYQKAKALHMVAKAKKTGVEARQVADKSSAETSVMKASAVKALSDAKRAMNDAKVN